MRNFAFVICVLVGFLPGPSSAAPEHLENLRARLQNLYDQKKYEEALPIAQKYVQEATREYGATDARLAPVLVWAALVHHALKQYPDAETAYLRSLSINEKALGPRHPQVADDLSRLVSLYIALERFEEAERLAKRALDIREKAVGSEAPVVAQSLSELASIYEWQRRFAEAEPLYARSLAIYEKVLPPDAAAVSNALIRLTAVYLTLGRYADGARVTERVLAAREKALGPRHMGIADTLELLSRFYTALARAADAEALLKRNLAIREAALGVDHPDVANSLWHLGTVLFTQGRYAEAEALLKRALQIREAAYGPEHRDVAVALTALANQYIVQGRYAEAEPALLRAVAIQEKARGPDNPALASPLNNLGILYQRQGRLKEGEAVLKRAIALWESASSRNSASSGGVLAQIYRDQGQYVQAERLLTRLLELQEKLHGRGSVRTAPILNELAQVQFAQGNWQRAAELWGRSADIVSASVLRESSGLGQKSNAKPATENVWYSGAFRMLVKAAFRAAPVGTAGHAANAGSMFEMAQWAVASDAAASLAQMNARGAAQDSRLAAMVRERQDLAAEWQIRDTYLTGAIALPAAKRDAQAEAAHAARMSVIDARIAEIDSQVAGEFASFTALTSPKPLSIEALQARLGADEAVVLFLVTEAQKPAPEETFVWAVSKTEVRWARSDLGAKALQERVAALRCGLDNAAWYAEGAARCSALLGTSGGAPNPLPFDMAKAHELYTELFSGLDDILDGKHLLIVPSGALTSLPFQTLVAKAPAAGVGYQAASWLARKHALTVVPSVSGLVAMRSNMRNSTALEPFIGFGDPILVGNPRCGTVFVPDRCPGEDEQSVAAAASETRGLAATESVETYFRDGRADPSIIKSQLCPLPDTAHELKCVARSLGAPASSIVLGKEMTEAALKRMRLDKYRVVQFATHGLLAGETALLAQNNAEPALVMTPPEVPSDDDDGLLTASEIAGLKLDADWVVMSACNTASGAKPGAEALSGLARAVLYAGARALLVSHWPVNSYAATMITSRTFAELRRDPQMGRSEAFRRAMLALMDDKQRPWAAHPAVWGPFVVVGEGGASARP